jgi:hypothetical protein
MDVFKVRHYGKDAAIRQKMEAFGGRREAQARDVFDLHLLVPHPAPERLVAFLAKELPTDRLKEAQARALAVTYAEYEGQVFEFLGEEARSRYGSESAWDETRLRVEAFISSVLKAQEGR